MRTGGFGFGQQFGFSLPAGLSAVAAVAAATYQRMLSSGTAVSMTGARQYVAPGGAAVSETGA